MLAGGLPPAATTGFSYVTPVHGAPSVTRRLIHDFASHPEPAAPRRELKGITDREREVLTLVGTGLANAEIAAELCISVATAKTYLTRLLAKLDARDRVQLVIMAYEAGLVSVRPAGREP